MRRFLRDFPLLAVPPVSSVVEEAPDYVELPKSRREIMAEER